jgi:hypothetical protein
MELLRICVACSAKPRCVLCDRLIPHAVMKHWIGKQGLIALGAVLESKSTFTGSMSLSANIEQGIPGLSRYHVCPLLIDRMSTSVVHDSRV